MRKQAEIQDRGKHQEQIKADAQGHGRNSGTFDPSLGLGMVSTFLEQMEQGVPDMLQILDHYAPEVQHGLKGVDARCPRHGRI